jgi:hypothetical protein
MTIRFLLPVAAGVLIVSSVSAQPVSTLQPGLVETLFESVESVHGESADYETLLHDLENLQRTPLNLNTAGKEDLELLPFLTDFQITSLLTYRQEHGNLLTIYELRVVYGYSDEVIRMMLPFVTVGTEAAENFSLDQPLRRGSHEITLRTQHILERAAGYKPADSLSARTPYPGSPWLYYAQYGFQSSHHLRAGITVEKDPGEEFFRGTNPKGFDFYSGYVMVNDAGPFKSLLAGDYRLQFGQGLTLWNGSAPGKSSLAMNIVKRQDGIKAFTSSDENDLFRGVASTAGFGKFIVTVFCSSKRRDANITDTLKSGQVCFSSFQETGYHRTLAETSDEKSVRENALGGNLHYHNNWLKAGFTMVHYTLDKYKEKGNELKDLYGFEGTSLLNWGIDYTATLDRIQLFGELSEGNRRWATLHGALFNLNKYASLSVLYRNYQPGFFSMHGSAFSENSSDNNEEAFYAGTIIHPFPHWQISAYADFYHFPWLRYRVNAPSSGSDYLVQVDYAAGRKTDMFIRLHYEDNPENDNTAAPLITGVTSVRRTGVRAHISWSPGSRLKFQDRVETVWVNTVQTHADKGILLYQDIEYGLAALPLTLNFRFAWFSTNSYNSRLYAYEQDLSSGFSFSPLYSTGYRTYLMIRYNINSSLSCRFRLSQINYSGKDFIGSSLDMLEGSTRTEIKLQLAARF